MVSNIENITTAERKMAKSSVELFAKHVNESNGNGTDSVEISFGDSSEKMQIPAKAFALLKSILGDMAEGKTITIESHDKEITVEEAAEIFFFLDPPHVEELLDKGEIPYQQQGDKKMMKMSDVLRYDEKLRTRRRKGLDEMVKMSQEMDLYDMVENPLVKE